MTVRKERRARGGAYWTAYWRVNGRSAQGLSGAGNRRHRRPPAHYRSGVARTTPCCARPVTAGVDAGAGDMAHFYPGRQRGTNNEKDRRQRSRGAFLSRQLVHLTTGAYRRRRCGWLKQEDLDAGRRSDGL